MSNAQSEIISTATQRRVVLGKAIDKERASDSLAGAPPEEELALLKDTVADLRRQLEQKDLAVSELKAVLKDAQQQHSETQKSLSRLEENVQEIEAEAVSQGYEAGLKKGAAEFEVASTKQADLWHESIDKLIEQHEKFCEKLKSQLVDVVMASVAKILGEKLTNAEAIKQAIDHIVRESGELQSFKIFIAPAHYEQLMEKADFQLNSMRGRRVELFPDARIEYGGCILEGENGLIDGRYEVQLARLRELLSTSKAELME